MQFTYEYCHSGVGGVAVPRLLFNLGFFLRHFHFSSLRRHFYNRTIFRSYLSLFRPIVLRHSRL